MHTNVARHHYHRLDYTGPPIRPQLSEFCCFVFCTQDKPDLAGKRGLHNVAGLMTRDCEVSPKSSQNARALAAESPFDDLRLFFINNIKQTRYRLKFTTLSRFVMPPCAFGHNVDCISEKIRT